MEVRLNQRWGKMVVDIWVKTTRTFDRMIPHYYHIHETSSGGQGGARAVEIATFEPRFRVSPKPEGEEGGTRWQCAVIKLDLWPFSWMVEGDHAHIFWTPWSKET